MLLTRIGGGVFENGDDWIDSAIVRAMDLVKDAGLDIVFVARGAASPGTRAIVDRYSAAVPTVGEVLARAQSGVKATGTRLDPAATIAAKDADRR